MTTLKVTTPSNRFIGYLDGAASRRKLHLDSYDFTNETVVLVFPDKIPTISQSFLRGLLGKSLYNTIQYDMMFNCEVVTGNDRLDKIVERYMKSIRVSILAQGDNYEVH
jgi:hypothetical protein